MRIEPERARWTFNSRFMGRGKILILILRFEEKNDRMCPGIGAVLFKK
jgi:hypothetical protein